MGQNEQAKDYIFYPYIFPPENFKQFLNIGYYFASTQKSFLTLLNFYLN